MPARPPSSIHASLPSKLRRLTEPVYDTATGRYLLVPQGSRIFGKYNSQVSYGQSRVQVVWNRVILPDTSSLKLDNLAGTDPAGYAGLEDDVDYHWGRIFAGAALVFFAYIGFDVVATTAEEAKNPQKDLPVGIIASLTICTILYCAVALVMIARWIDKLPAGVLPDAVPTTLP